MATKSKAKPTANGTPTPPGDVLTLAEAAAFLRVPEAGLRQDAEAGRVPGRRVAGEWRFSRDGLHEWLGRLAPTKLSDKERLGSLIGIWKDDPTADALTAEFERKRKRQPVGGK
jgi:excisionase family DNA binding protein